MTILTSGLTLALAPLLSLQAAGETAIAIKNDTPEIWTVEYPRLIQPYVADYRGCLHFTDRMVRGIADFEEQHRSDLPRCAEVSLKAQEAANRALADRGEYQGYTPADVTEVFAHIGRIHVARGADLDHQFTMRMQGTEQAKAEYNRTKPKGLVIELRDASVVKARLDETNAMHKTGTK